MSRPVLDKKYSLVAYEHRWNERRLRDSQSDKPDGRRQSRAALAVGASGIILLVGEATALPDIKQCLKQEEKFPRLSKAFSGLIDPMKVSAPIYCTAAGLPAGGG